MRFVLYSGAVRDFLDSHLLVRCNLSGIPEPRLRLDGDTFHFVFNKELRHLDTALYQHGAHQSSCIS